jgi:amino acid adenylation domain-containing protein
MSWQEQDTDRSIPEAFARTREERGEHLAIVSDNGSLTYAQLGELADGIAAAIRQRRPDAGRVALLLRHDAPVVAAALAALECGMAVVALNPSEPPARLAQVRARVEPEVLITDHDNLERATAAGFTPEQTIVTSELDSDAAPGREARDATPGSDDLAFLISTSGTSGRPKIVMQSHRNVLHNVLRYANGLGITPDDRVAWLASLSGGQGLASVWTTLLSGATLCPFPIAERGVATLGDWIEQQGVTVLDTIPSVLRNFARTLGERRIGGVRLVRLASERAVASDFEAFRRHFPTDCALASVLASSEAAIIAQTILRPGDRLSDERLPVGHPAEGIEVLVLDERGEPVPDGEPGEIVVASRYLSQGYWRDEELTAQRFQAVEGKRRLRTGDLARRSPDGALTITGRSDKQVKVRGYRLQLEEVEAALAAQPEILAAAVALDTTERGDARLTGYLILNPDRAIAPAELRKRLQSTLAPHAIPSSFVQLDELPLTPHGKIDPQRLGKQRPLGGAGGKRPPEPAKPSEARASQTQTAEILAGAWSEALDRDVGPHEPFLELGGDSLTAAVIAARVYELFGVELDLRVFASDITVSALAALVDQDQGAGPHDDIPPLRRSPRMGPLSTAQARVWRSRAFKRTDPFWNVAVPFRIRGPLDPAALRKSIDHIVRRHEILRTTFTQYGGTPMAVVRALSPTQLAIEDLRGEPDADAKVQEILDQELRQPFDLEQGPLLRWRLLRVGPQEYRLLRMSHHMIHDALSWRVFFRELAVTYEALQAGTPPPLKGAPPLQYLDYAIWERAALRPKSRRYQDELAWWRRRFEAPAPPPPLPFERAEPDSRAQPGEGFLRWGIEPQHATALDQLGRACGATFFMTRLATASALLALETGTEDLVIGTPASTRTRPELQDMIGVFLNYVLVRLRFTGEPTFQQWLGEVRRSVIDTSARVSIPTERLRRELRAEGVRLPVPAARFVAWPTLAPMRFGGIEVEPLPRRCAEASGFRLGVNRAYEADRCWAEFDPKVHDPVGVEQFLGRLRALIAAVAAEPDRPLRDLHAAVAVL